MRHYDFTPLHRSLIGFDRMASLIDAATKLETSPGYPPYNIEQIDEEHYQIELAVAGFSEDELSLESHKNVLTVTGAAKQDEAAPQRNFVHRGIAGRSFERRFQLADHVIVQSATVKNGLLSIALRRELPEALKPRKIVISSDAGSAANDKTLTSASSSGKVKAA